MGTKMKIASITLVSIVAIGIVGLLIWRIGFLMFIDKHELGFTYNKMTGVITPVEHTGWLRITPFIIEGHTIDLRPSQVCMNANSRVLNCKLVQFNPKGLDTFIQWHGREVGEDRRIYEILKSYAFNVDRGKDCPFLTIIDEMERKEKPPVETK